jgi:hypothetical protein
MAGITESAKRNQAPTFGTLKVKRKQQHSAVT